MADVNISIDGLTHLKSVTTPSAYDEIIQTIVTKGAFAGEGYAKEASPVDTGRLRGAITNEVGQLTARYGVMGGGGTVGVYGMALEAPRTRNPHYRGGPRAGQSTRGWFSDTKQKTQAKVDELTAEAVVKIESKWANG